MDDGSIPLSIFVFYLALHNVDMHDALFGLITYLTPM